MIEIAVHLQLYNAEKPKIARDLITYDTKYFIKEEDLKDKKEAQRMCKVLISTDK